MGQSWAGTWESRGSALLDLRSQVPRGNRRLFRRRLVGFCSEAQGSALCRWDRHVPGGPLSPDLVDDAVGENSGKMMLASW